MALYTAVTWESLTCLQPKIGQGSVLDSPTRHQFLKLANATEKAFADHSILLDKNRLLFEQSNKNTTRQSVKSTISGYARVMTYDDMVEAQQKRAAKVSAAGAKRGDWRG